MLETIRQYAHEKMLDTYKKEQLNDLHLDFFLEFAEEAEPFAFSAEAPTWMDRVLLDWDNFRTAIHWSLEGGRFEKGLRISNALGFYAHAIGHLHEHYQTMLKLLKSRGKGMRTLTLGKGLLITAAVGNELGKFSEVRIHFEESITILRKTGTRGRRDLEMALSYFAYALLWSEPRLAAHHAKEAVELCRASGNSNGLAVALVRLAEAQIWMNDIESARVFLKESSVLAQEVGNQFIYLVLNTDLGIAEFADGNLNAARSYFDLFNDPVFKSFKMWPAISNTFFGAIARIQGNKDLSQTLLEEAVRTFQELGDKRWTATALVYLGRLQLEQGNWPNAENCIYQALILARESDALLFVSWSLESFAFLCQVSNQPRRAAILLGVAGAIREKLETPLLSVEQDEYDSCLASLHAKLDGTSFETAWSEGRAMSMEQAIEFVLTHQKTH